METALIALAVLAMAGTAAAQQAAPAATPPRPPPAPPAPSPSVALALEAAQTALSKCVADGYKVAVTVVDANGVLKVVLVGDGVGPGAAGSGNRKAQAALKFKENSAVLQERAAKDPAFAAQVAADNTLFARAGAQLIMSKGAIIGAIGAIGVGGAPGGDKDDACTSAGLAKIKDRL